MKNPYIYIFVCAVCVQCDKHMMNFPLPARGPQSTSTIHLCAKMSGLLAAGALAEQSYDSYELTFQLKPMNSETAQLWA